MLRHQASLLLCHWLNRTVTRGLTSYLPGRESWSTGTHSQPGTRGSLPGKSEHLCTSDMPEGATALLEGQGFHLFVKAPVRTCSAAGVASAGLCPADSNRQQLGSLAAEGGVELRIASVQPLPAEAGGEVFAKTSQQNSLSRLNIALGFCLRAQAAVSTPALL